MRKQNNGLSAEHGTTPEDVAIERDRLLQSDVQYIVHFPIMVVWDARDTKGLD